MKAYKKDSMFYVNEISQEAFLHCLLYFRALHHSLEHTVLPWLVRRRTIKLLSFSGAYYPRGRTNREGALID